MKTLIVAEHDNQTLKAATLNAVRLRNSLAAMSIFLLLEAAVKERQTRRRRLLASVLYFARITQPTNISSLKT